MIRSVAFVLFLVTMSAYAQAEAFNDCSQKKDLNRQIRGCSRYIDANVSSRALQVWENVTAAIGARGQAYRRKGKYDLAIKDFTRVIKRNGEVAPVALLNRAISYEAIGERDKAIQDYREIVQFLKNNPFHKPKYGPHASHATKALTRLEAASATETSANKPVPKSNTGDPELEKKKALARELNNVGNHQVFSGNIDAAIAAFSKSIAIYPNYYALSSRSILYEKIGRKADAVADHRKAQQLNPNELFSEQASKAPSPKSTKLALKQSQDAYARALAHRKARRFGKAIAEFTNAIKLNRNNASAYLDRGVAYVMKGQDNRALSDFSEAIRLKPGSPSAYHRRGLLYYRTGRYDRAIKDFTSQIKFDPQNIYGYNNRGRAYRKYGKYDRAIADHTEVIRLKPKFAFAYNDRGHAYYEKGAYARAMAEFDKAVKLNPKLASAYRNRGNVYARLGKYKKADAEYAKANKIDPKGVMIVPTKVKPAKKAKPAPEPEVSLGNVSNAMELAFWNDVKNSNDPAMLQAYLDQFPKGTFATLAKIKLSKLKKAQ